jgi:hypothetical protein
MEQFSSADMRRAVRRHLDGDSSGHTRLDTEVPESSVQLMPSRLKRWEQFFVPIIDLKNRAMAVWLLLACSTAPASQPGTEFALPAPDVETPVTAGMRVVPAQDGRGILFEVEIRARIAPSYHIYATNETRGPFAPVSVKLTLPQGVEAQGDWIASKPVRAKDDRLIYTNSVVLRHSLRVVSNAPTKTLSIKAELRFQACSDDFCWPPRTIEISAPLTVVAEKEPKP